jgi:hypothetical protein
MLCFQEYSSLVKTKQRFHAPPDVVCPDVDVIVNKSALKMTFKLFRRSFP